MKTLCKMTVGAVGSVVVVVVLSHAALNYLRQDIIFDEGDTTDPKFNLADGEMLSSLVEWVDGIEEQLLEGNQVLQSELDESNNFLSLHDHKNHKKRDQVHEDEYQRSAIAKLRLLSHAQQAKGSEQVNVTENKKGYHPALFGGTEKGLGAHQRSASDVFDHLCSKSDWPDIDHYKLFIIVLSSLTAVGAKQRAASRETWIESARTTLSDDRLQVKLANIGNNTPEFGHNNNQIKFFVGHSETRTTVSEIAAKDEQEKYKDIVHLDVPDTYTDLIEKVRQAFLWAAQNTISEYVLKVDDDAYVNVPLMMKTIDGLPSSRLYFGYLMNNVPLLRSSSRLSSRNKEKSGVGYLPDMMPGHFSPYMSGAGYMISCDLVHVVSSPVLKPVKMLNEDAYMGIVLLPFNITRITSSLIYPYGILGVCINPSNVGVVHYLKEGNKYGCMRNMHANITSGNNVCRTKFCNVPKSLCTYAHPASAGKCRVSENPKWKVISPKAACERNSEGVVRRSHAQVMNKECCLKLCEETCWCVAVDYYVESVWCNLYDKPCKQPSQINGGQPSSMLFVSRTTGEMPGGVPYGSNALANGVDMIKKAPLSSTCPPNAFSRNLTGYVCKGLQHESNGDVSQEKCRLACCSDKTRCGLYQWADPKIPQGGCWLGWTNVCTQSDDLAESGRESSAIYWVGEGEPVHEPTILDSEIVPSDWGKFK